MLFKKRFKIDGVSLSCAEYYPAHNYDVVDPIYWLRTSDYKICDGEEMIEKGIFQSAGELLSSDDYIPYAKSDVTQAEKDFMDRFCPEEKSELEKIRVSHPDCEGDYDIAFRIFIEAHPLSEKWDEFCNKRLLNDVVSWCEQNNIKYVIAKTV